MGRPGETGASRGCYGQSASGAAQVQGGRRLRLSIRFNGREGLAALGGSGLGGLVGPARVQNNWKDLGCRESRQLFGGGSLHREAEVGSRQRRRGSRGTSALQPLVVASVSKWGAGHKGSGLGMIPGEGPSMLQGDWNCSANAVPEQQDWADPGGALDRPGAGKDEREPPERLQRWRRPCEHGGGGSFSSRVGGCVFQHRRNWATAEGGKWGWARRVETGRRRARESAEGRCWGV